MGQDGQPSLAALQRPCASRPRRPPAAAAHPPPLPLALSPPLPPVLKLAPGDADALRAKVVLLIEGGSHDDALKLASQPAQAASMAFERVRAVGGSWAPSGCCAGRVC